MSLPDRLPSEPVPIRAEIELAPVERVIAPSPFVGAAPKVTLQRDESTLHPFSVAVAAAWSCYGGKPAKVASRSSRCASSLACSDSRSPSSADSSSK